MKSYSKELGSEFVVVFKRAASLIGMFFTDQEAALEIWKDYFRQK